MSEDKALHDHLRRKEREGVRMNTVKHYMRQFGKFLQHKAWLAVCFLILCVCDVLDRNLTMLAIHSALAHLLFCQESTESQIAKIVEQIDWRRERRKNLTKNDLVDDDADKNLRAE